MPSTSMRISWYSCACPLPVQVSLKKNMNVLAYKGQFHSTDASADYSAYDTFNFLILMVCFAEKFSHGMIVCGEGVGLFLMKRNMREIDQAVPRKLRIYFFPDKIYYWFNKAMHHYTHVPTVRYIYHLMSLMDSVYWMKVVLSKVYTKKVKSLQHICMMKCPLQQDESTLRRYLMLVQTLIKGFS